MAKMTKGSSLGALVSCQCPEQKNSYRCSGIILDSSWVLTTGTILADAVHDQTNFKKMCWKDIIKETELGKVICMEDMKVEKLIQFSVFASAESSQPICHEKLKLTSSIPFNCDQTTGSNEDSFIKRTGPHFFQQNHSRVVSEFNAELKYIWRCPLVTESIKMLLLSWHLGSGASSTEDADTYEESELVKMLLPMFLLLKLRDVNDQPDDFSNFLESISSFCESSDYHPQRGQLVVINATPFGSISFYNSLSEGVVSNTCGSQNCLLLTDARTAVCCEGGPIYTVKIWEGRRVSNLVGMVLCSLKWLRGEWVGFTLGVDLQPVFLPLLHSCDRFRQIVASDTPRNSNFFDWLDDCIVLVRCGFGWGSGIVVDSGRGIILTCSHVVKKEDCCPVTVCWKQHKVPAEVIFRSKEDIAYDVAVLRVSAPLNFKQVVLSPQAPVRGEQVLASGFPLFSEDDNVLPTVTRGIVAHVSDPISMVQTTCCVQSGCSGGALFRNVGEVVGLISCNILDSASGALHPRINMAVPSCILAGPVNNFLRTEDVEFLEALESSDLSIQQIWKLKPGLSKL